jgi:hypothetical protein
MLTELNSHSVRLSYPERRLDGSAEEKRAERAMMASAILLPFASLGWTRWLFALRIWAAVMLAR